MNAVNPKSIRQIICTALIAGVPSKDIALAVQAAHPESAAAKKSAKHIGWYKADLKKRGLLPTATATPATVSIPATVDETKAPKQNKAR